MPSSFTRETVAERFGVASERVPYCYDSNRFVPGPAARVSPPVLLTVSRLRPHKNQALVLHAAAALPAAVQVRLIGRGPEQAALEALAFRLGVACRVETTADDAAVTLAYREASVAVCPSRFEGFGLTPIEAVASGIPVVASDIPPAPRVRGRRRPAVRARRSGRAGGGDHSRARRAARRSGACGRAHDPGRRAAVPGLPSAPPALD